jgi:hypothetical protein
VSIDINHPEFWIRYFAGQVIGLNILAADPDAEGEVDFERLDKLTTQAYITALMLDEKFRSARKPKDDDEST